MFEREGKRERVVDGERSIVDLELVPRTPRTVPEIEGTAACTVTNYE